MLIFNPFTITLLVGAVIVLWASNDKNQRFTTLGIGLTLASFLYLLWAFLTVAWLGARWLFDNYYYLLSLIGK